MKIAFVGKGGSGKTTLATLFSQYAKEKTSVLAIDADLNMHLGVLLGFETPMPKEQVLSHPAAAETIKTYLRGNNARIKNLAHFRKTTPPTNDSKFIKLTDGDLIISQYSIGNWPLRLVVVGTYDTDDIGASCYHNNLAILENVLSHLIDDNGTVVVDMVAGVDAFANTLHAQFDMLVLVVEPTQRSIEVFHHYQQLANEAGISGSLFVVGNKVGNEVDQKFIETHIPKQSIIGFLGDSSYLHKKDQEGGSLNLNLLEPENQKLLETIYQKLTSLKPDYRQRLEVLHNLHRRYVAQGFIVERYGDLTDQIDESFDINTVHEAK